MCRQRREGALRWGGVGWGGVVMGEMLSDVLCFVLVTCTTRIFHNILY